MRQEPRIIEIAPGETRQFCLVCDTPIKGQGAPLYCPEHQAHKVNSCEQCGKGTSGTVCEACRLNPPVEKAAAQVRGGKRVLTKHDRPVVEKLWAENLTSREIAEYLGLSTATPSATINRRRRQGWKLPYRYPWAIERGRRLAKESTKKKQAKVSA